MLWDFARDLEVWGWASGADGGDEDVGGWDGGFF